MSNSREETNTIKIEGISDLDQLRIKLYLLKLMCLLILIEQQDFLFNELLKSSVMIKENETEIENEAEKEIRMNAMVQEFQQALQVNNQAQASMKEKMIVTIRQEVPIHNQEQMIAAINENMIIKTRRQIISNDEQTYSTKIIDESMNIIAQLNLKSKQLLNEIHLFPSSRYVTEAKPVVVHYMNTDELLQLLRFVPDETKNAEAAGNLKVLEIIDKERKLRIEEIPLEEKINYLKILDRKIVKVEAAIDISLSLDVCFLLIQAKRGRSYNKEESSLVKSYLRSSVTIGNSLSKIDFSNARSQHNSIFQNLISRILRFTEIYLSLQISNYQAPVAISSLSFLSIPAQHRARAMIHSQSDETNKSEHTDNQQNKEAEIKKNENESSANYSRKRSITFP